MKAYYFRYLFFIVSLFVVINTFAQRKDTDTTSLHYPLVDKRQPYQGSSQLGVQLNTPSNLKRDIQFDPKTNQYIFTEKIGDTYYSSPYSMSIEEYEKSVMKDSSKSYWDERARSDNKTGSSTYSPKLNIGIEAFDKVFGSNAVNITPQGSAELIFGVSTSKINNPNISENLRKTTTFDFQQKIQMNVTGTIGDKLKLGVNYNTEATFDFENKTKLEYTGKEDEIIRKVEAGNVSLPLTGSLITGSQSLFGLKTELQFGKLNVVLVGSQQKGESKTVTVKGGAQETDFEFSADEYEANKHFFLAHYFRNKYEDALSSLPLINSKIVITKIEAWVINKSGSTTDLRNIVAFTDLGEAVRNNTVPRFGIIGLTNDSFPRNEISGLYSVVKDNVRDFQDIATYLNTFSTYGFSAGKDYVKVQSARKLASSEYSYNSQLGYISLTSALNSNQVLAVAYEYTYKGKTYQVGEFSSDLSSSSQTLVLKLIKGTNLTPRYPYWDLMMKNVYSLGGYQISSTKFKFNVVYKNDKSGLYINYIPESQTNKDILLKVMGLDNLNSNNESGADGMFDFIEGVTIKAATGKVIFPKLEPFGSSLKEYMKDKNVSSSTIDDYAFTELYDSTLTKAKKVTTKDKFYLKGTFQSSVSSDISLNALNIPAGSVVVTAGGITLVENVDYTVDYTMGRVKIINEGLLESGTAIKISLESSSAYNIQTKTFFGAHLNYQFSDNFNIGGTIINLTERPLTEKVSIGDEPISNTILGLNGSYTTKSDFLTKLVDKIPLIDTKETSTFTINGECAYLAPGHPKAINNSAYIDDFEGSETSIDLMTFSSWSLASTPGDATLFPESQYSNDLKYGYNRAKLAWYVIDPLFLEGNSSTPSNIKNNSNETSSFFVSLVYKSDLFPNVDVTDGTETSLSVLNLAYYPLERGPYNYDATNVNKDGSLKNPQTRWGGIQRPITTTDFEAANIQYIEFWMLDPFCEDETSTNSGSLYFDLGDVSEDVLKDSYKSYENGFSSEVTSETVNTTAWGNVPNGDCVLYAFDNDESTRTYQDIGLDGLSDDQEKTFFKSYLKQLASIGVDTSEITDPSSDDFHYFRGTDYDNESLGILARYKKYNGLENNSPVSTTSSTYSASNSTLPNKEDADGDFTMSEDENFYQYKVDISRNKLKVGSNYIVDSVHVAKTMPNGKYKEANWYQFRIPITDYNKTVGTIDDFTSIRFMRMFLTGFSDSVILRFAELNLVKGEWMPYSGTLKETGEYSTTSDDGSTLDIGSVNIEENSSKSPVNYVLPPGVTRETDPTSTTSTQLNEQAMVFKVTDLNIGEAKAAYKDVDLDLRQYGNLKMFVHGEMLKTDADLSDDELTVFVRLGSDLTENYYEYEIPLKLTPWSTSYNNDDDADRYKVWPEANNIDISLDDLKNAKLARNKAMASNSLLYASSKIFTYTKSGKNGKYYVRGYPNLSNVKNIMLGVRYPQSDTASSHTKSVEVWVNELRLTDFNDKGGGAANLQVITKLADFANLSVSGTASTAGFGSLDQGVTERSMDNIKQYNIAANVELGKFFPAKSGVQIPMYAAISETYTTPEYNPLDPDIKLKAALQNLSTKAERDSLLYLVRAYSTTRSLNFTNVKISNKGKGKKNTQFYDISNFTLNYANTETYKRDINTERDIDKTFSGGLLYSYQFKPKNVMPFQKNKLMSGSPMKLIHDFNFNYMPTSISFKTDLHRTYSETKLRNIEDPGLLVDSTVSKTFKWNRYYSLAWDITKQLKFDISATNTARIDEPDGAVNKKYRGLYNHWKDSVWNNIQKGGRTTYYQHQIQASYTTPIQKIPFLDWTSLTFNYSANYSWTLNPTSADTTKDIGNTIANSGTLTRNAQLNFTNLYNKFPYFKKLLQNSNKKVPQKAKKTKKVTFEKDRINLIAGQAKNINHNLGSMEVKVSLKDTSGQIIKGKTKIINENKITFTPEVDYKGAKAIVEADIEIQPSVFSIITEGILKAALGVKNVSVTWTTNNTSSMPGFMPRTHLMGLSADNAPGLPFILGMVRNNFPNEAIHSGWLTKSSYMTSAYTTGYNDNISYRISLEPLSGFKIELTGNRNYTRGGSSYYSVDDLAFQNYTESGSFNMSFISVSSAFEKVEKSNGKFNSKVFNNFKNNRIIISQRLAALRSKYDNTYSSVNYTPESDEEGTNGYGLLSQDVLIPAFMSAYGNIDPNKVTLKRFPSILHAMPNWRVSYDGLTKIPLVKKYVKSANINHSYKCTYNIGSYAIDSDYDLDEYLSMVRDLQNNYISLYDVSSVSISEQFSPLISIDATLVNGVTASFSIKNSRNVSLSLTNNAVNQNMTKEIVFGAGYKFKDFGNLFIKSNTGTKAIDPGLNLRADVSIRDNKVFLRYLSSNNDQSTSGSKVLTIKVSADYKISENFNLNVFYNRIVTTPFVSTSYPTANTNVGFSVSFSLAKAK